MAGILDVFEGVSKGVMNIAEEAVTKGAKPTISAVEEILQEGGESVSLRSKGGMQKAFLSAAEEEGALRNGLDIKKARQNYLRSSGAYDNYKNAKLNSDVVTGRNAASAEEAFVASGGSASAYKDRLSKIRLEGKSTPDAQIEANIQENLYRREIANAGTMREGTLKEEKQIRGQLRYLNGSDGFNDRVASAGKGMTVKKLNSEGFNADGTKMTRAQSRDYKSNLKAAVSDSIRTNKQNGMSQMASDRVADTKRQVANNLGLSPDALNDASLTAEEIARGNPDKSGIGLWNFAKSHPVVATGIAVGSAWGITELVSED